MYKKNIVINFFFSLLILNFVFNFSFSFAALADETIINETNFTDWIPSSDELTSLLSEVEEGSLDAKVSLAWLYLTGQGYRITENSAPDSRYYIALELFQEVAENGEKELAATNMVNAAYACFLGTDSSIRPNDEAALLFFQAAADIGNADAMNTLGIFYTYGLEVDQDPTKALELFCRSYENGCNQALLSIEEYAYDYYSGQDLIIDVNFITAFQYYEKLAYYGNGRGMYNLGIMYLYGLGVEQDYSKASEWFTKAADMGDMPEASDALLFLASK